jgi:hypothetical protein
MQLLNVGFDSFFFPCVQITQLHAKGIDRASFSRVLLTDSQPTEEVYFGEVLNDKNGKPEAVKNCKQFSIVGKSMGIGWRQENVIDSEIGRCLECGVDAIGWLSLFT